MKKTLLITLIGTSLFLAGCIQQTPITNQNLNQPVADQNQNVNQPAVNVNQNTNQALQDVNQNINTNQQATNQNVNQQPAQQVVATKQPESTCQSTNECIGATKVECLKDWLTRSKCFSESYFNAHFTNFRLDPSFRPRGKEAIRFDFVLNDNLVLNSEMTPENSAYAIIDGEPNNYKLLEYVGPLKEYQVNISKQEAFKIAKADSFCKISNQTNIMDLVFLVVSDELDAFDYEYGNIYLRYDTALGTKGLYWNIPTTQCGTKCQVDAITGDLNKIDVGCEY